MKNQFIFIDTTRNKMTWIELKNRCEYNGITPDDVHEILSAKFKIDKAIFEINERIRARKQYDYGRKAW